MRPSSAIFTILGEHLRHLGMEVWVGTLIQCLGQFGISEGAVRVTLSRMSQQGWVESRKIGQKSFYRLTEKGQKRIAEGLRRVYHQKETQWDGQWRIVMYTIPETMKDIKDQLRKELTWTGFGYLGNNVWISPHNLYSQVMEIIEEHQLHHYVDVYTARYEGPQSNRELVHKAWDLAYIDQAYQSFLDQFEPMYEKLYQLEVSGKLTDPEAFKGRIQLVHQFRKFLFIDPKLPQELLPSDWIGERADRFFRQFHQFLTPKAEKYFYSCLVTPGDEE